MKGTETGRRILFVNGLWALSLKRKQRSRLSVAINLVVENNVGW
jgi:hypothetical protein